jgi:hypothetical protein
MKTRNDYEASPLDSLTEKIEICQSILWFSEKMQYRSVVPKINRVQVQQGTGIEKVIRDPLYP